MHKVGKKGQFSMGAYWMEILENGRASAGRRIFAFVATILFSISLHAQSRISFPKTYHYFGNIKEEKGAVTKEFPFVNKGKTPLVVKQVKTTCGCTVSSFSRDSIAPGDSGRVFITFNPAGRPGIFRKTATVITNGRPNSTVLTINGQVRPRPKGPRDYYPFKEGNLRFKTNLLTFHKMLDNAEKTLSTILYNAGEEVMEIDLAHSEVPSHLAVRISKATLAPGDTAKMWVRYDAQARQDWGELFDTFYMKTSDKERPMKRISASAHVRQYFPKSGSKAKLVAGETKVDFGEVEEGEVVAHPIEVKNTGSKDLVVRKVVSQCSCLEFRWPEAPIPPGESAQVLALFNTRGRIGKVEKEFKLITNSPHNSELIFPVFIQIEKKNNGD